MDRRILRQHQEFFGDDEWGRRHRAAAPCETPGYATSRAFSYDRLFGMATPAYGRYRFSWETEWTGRVRPYVGVEEFVEHAGIQRSRPSAGVRFRPARYLDTDLAYIYDRIYLRATANRHILQTTLTFHRRGRD